MQVLIENGIVFSGIRFIKGLSVRLANGYVTECGEAISAGDDEECIDLEGDYLLPGFVDVHIHAFQCYDTMRGETDIRQMSIKLASNGTAAFCPTTMSASAEETKKVLADIRRVMERPETGGALVLGAHMEAPFLSGEKAGAQQKQFFRDPDWQELVRMAQAMNLEADEADYRQRLEALRERIHETFYHDGLYASGSQVDMIYPLLVGVVPDGLKEQVVAKLKERTETLYNGHLATGLVGIPVLTEWVTRAGECDWMYSMLKKHGYPGYLHMLDNGATGVWEHWDGARSRLHNCFNGILRWFYEALGGIVADEPGYRKVHIAPQLPEGVEWVEVTRETPYGVIEVRHKRQPDGSIRSEVNSKYSLL